MRSLKAILIAICCSFFYHLSAQDTIHWHKNYKLSWSDFKGNPTANSNHNASTSSGISYSYRLRGTEYSFTTAAFFDKNKSWSKTGNRNILTHEQGHFDITEIYARKLLQALNTLSADTIITEKKIIALAEKIIADKNSYQRKYDLETGSGSNATGQQKWNKIIQTALSQ